MSEPEKSGGLTIAGLLGVAFVILKLCNVITWKWLWVLCPFWIGLALFIVFFIIGLLGITISAIIDNVTNKKIEKTVNVEFEIINKDKLN